MNRAAVALIMFVCALSHGAVNKGMVLIERKVSSGGKLEGFSFELKYLSSGKTTMLESAPSKSVQFSLDGQKVVFFHRRLDSNGRPLQELYTMNIDGTGRTKILNSILNKNDSGLRWATDGYIYWASPNVGTYRIVRCPATGDASNYEIVHTLSDRVNTPIGTTVEAATGSFQLSRDGTRATMTAPHKNSGGGKAGWAQFNVDLATGKDFSAVKPCQGGISPSGELLSVSQAGHRQYRIIRWPNTFVDYGSDGNTYSGCAVTGGQYNKPYGLCPDYEMVINAGPDLNAMFNIGDSWSDNPEISDPRFSSSSDDVFIFSTSKPANEQSGGSWLYQLSTGEYTKVAPIGTDIADYFPQEITLTSDYKITPAFLQITVNTAADAPVPEELSLTSQNDMAGEPAMSGVPSWMTVTTTRVSSREYSLTCAANMDALPGDGTYEATLTVTPDGSSQALSVSASLVVESALYSPITIANPKEGQVYHVGDTLRVEFSADPTVITGTLISISVDGGKSWWPITAEDSYETGLDQVLEYTIPAELSNPLGTPQSAVSDQCIVMVSNYPEGYETQTGMFSIAANESLAGRRGRPSPLKQLRVSVSKVSGKTTLTITAPSHGTARLVNVHGRTVERFYFGEGRRRHVELGSLKPGRYVLSAEYGSGKRETRAIQAY